jgi:hypothetical protein
LFVAHESQELDVILQAEGTGESLQALALVAIACDLQNRPALREDQGHGLDKILDPFPRDQPAGEQNLGNLIPG